MAQRLRALSGSVLLGSLALAPLNYGSTRSGAFLVLLGGAAAGGILWAWSHLAARRVPHLPFAMSLGAALVAAVALAWLLWLPAPAVPAFTVKHFARIAARWPDGIVPGDHAWLTAWAATAVLALCAIYDLAHEETWRRAFAFVLVGAGVAVAVIGLLQNATHAPGIYWDHSRRLPGTFFGTFYHHTSAGAYLNTVWPVAATLALDGLRSADDFSRRLGAVTAVAACIVFGAHAGHISRFPQVIALVALAAALVWLRPWQLTAGKKYSARTGLVAVLIACTIPIGLAAGAGRLGTIGMRWSELKWTALRGGAPSVPAPRPEQWPRLMRDDLFIPSDHREYPLGDRGAAYATARRAIAQRPVWGWGPGGWMAAAAANSIDPFIRTFFQMLQFTHEDFLQTLVEWGAIGAAGWALLILGGATRAGWRLGFAPGRDLLGAGAVLALFAVLTQSLIDFPLQIPAVQFNAIALAALAWSTPRRRPAEFPFSP